MDYIKLTDNEYDRSPVIIVQGEACMGKTVAVVRYLTERGISWDLLCYDPGVFSQYRRYIKSLFEGGVLNTMPSFGAARVNRRNGYIYTRYNRTLVIDCGSVGGSGLIKLVSRYLYSEWCTYYHKIILICNPVDVKKLIGGRKQ